MRPRREANNGRLWVALLVAMVVHIQAIIGGWIYGLLHPFEEADEIEYIAVSEDELPAESLPKEAPIELPREQTKPAPKQPTPSPSLAQPATPVPPPNAPSPQKVAPEPPQAQRLKSVEQNYDKDEEENKSARFLGEKNKHVRPEDETRAEATNLERESKGEASETPNDSKDKRVGDGEEKVGRLTVKQGKSEKKRAPIGRAERKAASGESSAEKRAAEARGGLAPEESGEFPAPVGDGKEGIFGPKLGAKLRRGLGTTELESLFGHSEHGAADPAEAPLAGEDARAKRPGHGYQKRWAQVQSALENFVPEVRPGNQTALGTRASPFAVYIATMHRSIHELWGFGVLSDWDSKGISHPANNMELWVTIEIVLKADGTVDKLTVARPSGVLPFDVAAIDVVMRASPYPKPPDAIRSKNGKTYIHWNFHRDERACGTFGASPFILDNPPDEKGHLKEG